MNFSHAGHYTFYSCLLLKLEIKVSFMMGQWFCSIGLLTGLTLCPSLHCETLIILARKIKSPFFCAPPPPTTIPFPYHMALKKRSVFGSPTFHHECRTALWCIFKQGLTHRMITLEELYLVMSLQKMYWNIVAYKWIDICWTLFFQSLNWRYACVLRDVFVQLMILVLLNYSLWLWWRPWGVPSCCAVQLGSSSKIPLGQ